MSSELLLLIFLLVLCYFFPLWHHMIYLSTCPASLWECTKIESINFLLKSFWNFQSPHYYIYCTIGSLKMNLALLSHAASTGDIKDYKKCVSNSCEPQESGWPRKSSSEGKTQILIRCHFGKTRILCDNDLEQCDILILWYLTIILLF